MSDKTNIMAILNNSWQLPAHFRPAIESALNEFAQEGYLFEGAKFTDLNATLIQFDVIAGPYDIFRLGVKVGYKLNSPAPAQVQISMDEALEDYLNAIRKAQDDHWTEMNFTIPKDEFSASRGKKFWKILAKGPGQKYGSVHCFVEIATGDIYKAATFNAPARGVRGNIRDEKRPVTLRDYYAK